MVVSASSVLAATVTGVSPLAVLAVTLGCGMIILGAGFAIGWIGSRAVESIARQPEAGARIFSTMVIAAALVEGVTFFSLLICFLALYWMR
jgi:F-type H+-transporting ATPase subunit c